MMKKFFALLLCLVLCLSLTACGQAERYPEIADMLDAADYEGAVMAIYELYRENNPTESTEPVPTEDPMLARKYNYLTNGLQNLSWYVENNYSLDGFNVYFNDGENDYNYAGIDGVAWLYNTALELGGYQDAAEIAGRFTLLEDVALNKTYWYEDALGNIMEDSRVYYVYGADGSILSQNSDRFQTGDNYGYNYGTPEYTYDENGNLTTLRYLSDETVNCVIDYTYNENGTLATEHYLDRSGYEFNVTYTYDENGRLIQAAGLPYSEYSETSMTVTYEYNEFGQLIHESGVSDNWDSTGWSKYVKTVDYTYDEAGNTASVRKATEYHTKENYDDTERYLEHYEDVRVWEYTYDENGRLIRNTYANIGYTDAEGNPENQDYRTYIGDTTYGTYYVYTPAAE